MLEEPDNGREPGNGREPDTGRDDAALRGSGTFVPRSALGYDPRRSQEACLELDALLGQSLQPDVLLALPLQSEDRRRELGREPLLTGGSDGLCRPVLDGSGGQLPLRDLSLDLSGVAFSSSDPTGLGGNHISLM